MQGKLKKSQILAALFSAAFISMGGMAHAAGDITATGDITAGGTVQTDTLTADSVEADSGTITGTMTIGGMANLNGGASLGGNRLTNVAAGTADTDAVNLAQLNEALAKAGKTYTAGSDIIISSDNAISVNKTGEIKSGNAGIVTGGTVYAVTNKLNSSIKSHATQIESLESDLDGLNDRLTSFKSQLGNINSSLTSAITSLNSASKNYMDTSLSNMTADGQTYLQNTIRDIIASQVSASSTQAATGANEATTLEATSSSPVVTATDTTVIDGKIEAGNTGLVSGGEIYDALEKKADKTYVDDALSTKVDKADFNKVKDQVDTNTADIADLKENKADKSYVEAELSKKLDVTEFEPVKKQVESNTADISNLKETKANADGSNIDVDKFAEKLGTGVVEKDNKGLVNGGAVYDALEKKADYAYVNGMAIGLNSQIQEMSQKLTRDMNKVGAGAAALAGLHPQDYDPDCKLDFAAGYGHYKNANASAIGMYYRPNGGTMLSLAGTIGNGDPMLSAGVSLKIGYNSKVEKVIVKKQDYEALQSRVDELTQVVQQLLAKKQAQAH